MFVDRADAGRKLARSLSSLGIKPDLVIAVPRGGVIVGEQVALAFNSPLEPIITKKIGAPNFPEVAVGAVTPDGSLVWNEELVRQLGASDQELQQQLEGVKQELSRRVRVYDYCLDRIRIKGKVIVLVDDGMATGYTVKAAAVSLQKREPKQLILAVPVCSVEAAEELLPYVDHLVCLSTPDPFAAVGYYYKKFEQNNDQQVLDVLARTRRESLD